MIQARIVLNLIDGKSINYANKYLYDKTVGGTVKDDGANNLLFNGFDGKSYYYTGYGNDTYADQTKAGEIKADYEALVTQVNAGTGFIKFAEADSTHATTTILERKNIDSINGAPCYVRTQVKAADVLSIQVVEEWVPYPTGREAGYRLPKSDIHFAGFNEYANLTAADQGNTDEYNKLYNNTKDSQ
jgi:hypothetical protein